MTSPITNQESLNKESSEIEEPKKKEFLDLLSNELKLVVSQQTTAF